MLRYWMHRLLFFLQLSPYNRVCDSCGQTTWSSVDKPDGRHLCLACHQKGGRP
jgi:formylmethanofuran dehydrogenase subunit E